MAPAQPRLATKSAGLSPGCAADLVMIDWHAVTHPYQNADLPVLVVLVQRAKASAVQTVMIAGEVVYDAGRFTRIDRGAVLQEIAERMRRSLTPQEDAQRSMS